MAYDEMIGFCFGEYGTSLDKQKVVIVTYTRLAYICAIGFPGLAFIY